MEMGSEDFELVGDEAEVDAPGLDLDAAISRFQKELDGLVDSELGDAVRGVARLRTKLEAVEIGLVGRFEQTTEWSRDGYRHPTAWVREECRVPRGAAGRRVGLSRKLRSMPHTNEAFAAGLIEVSHVDRLAKSNSTARSAAFAEAEALLVGNAIELPFEEFVKTVDYFEQLVDPDPDGDAEDRDSKRRVHSSKMFNGLGKVDAVLDPVGWSIFDECLRRIEKELFDADWAELVAEHGDAACIDMLGRTPRQRRADAMVEMAQRAETVPADGRRPEPSVIVHVDAKTLEAETKRRLGAPHEFGDDRVCELQDGTVITPGQALALAIEGCVRRLVYDSDGVVLDFGRQKRFFTGGLRKMIEARDRHCTGPGCDVPSWACDVDHIIDWQHSGETRGDNGELKCRWHNLHKPEYSITTDPITGRARWHRSSS